MKKYIYSALALSTLILGACNDDDLNGGKGKNEGDFIEFTLSGARSRIIYEDQDTINGVGENEWQINWEENDPIRIYSVEAKSVTQSSNADASYTITNIKSDGNYHDGYLTRVGENGLQWGTAPTHDFFAVFPDDGKKIASYDHTNKVVTFNFNANQPIKFLKKDTDGNYTAVLDMTNAYMVAVNTGVTNGESVPLEFDPIMTTLEINVKGQGEGNNVVLITGVSIVTTFNAGESVISSTGTFQYDIDDKKILPIENSSAATQTIFVEIPGGVSLTGTQTLNVTAFVPPVTLTSANTKIQVHSTTKSSDDTNDLTSVGVSRQNMPTTVEPSHKKILMLPYLPNPATNNWITPLDNNIYVSQLSIPGTHDSATFGLKIGTATGKAQTATIDQQLEMGIRAFDLRPYSTLSQSTSSTDLEISHGIWDCNYTMSEVFTDFEEYLSKNEGEFVIVIMRDETGDKRPASVNINNRWSTIMYNFLNSNTVYQNRKIDFKPNLTVGEMRGKILVLSRNTYNNGPFGGYIQDFSANSAQSSSASTGTHWVYGAAENTTGEVWVQDWYDHNDASGKVELVKKFLDISAKYHTDESLKNTWMVNHCSGYLSGYNYPGAAAGVNKPVYDYLTGTEKPVGSTGIMLLDFVGVTTYSRWTDAVTYNVYGYLLPQAIIDNNYKYVMKRASN